MSSTGEAEHHTWTCSRYFASCVSKLNAEIGHGRENELKPPLMSSENYRYRVCREYIVHETLVSAMKYAAMAESFVQPDSHKRIGAV